MTKRSLTLIIGGLAALGAGLGVGIASETGSAAAPHISTPPGWVAHPVGHPATTVCFGGACYHVDAHGHPYGQPMTSTSA